MLAIPLSAAVQKTLRDSPVLSLALYFRPETLYGARTTLVNHDDTHTEESVKVVIEEVFFGARYGSARDSSASLAG
jgi:hypothetical protein